MQQTNTLTPGFSNEYFPDVLEKLYKINKKSYWFTDARACEDFKGYNLHHFTVVDMIFSFIKKYPGSIISVFGPMGSGKSAVLVLLEKIIDRKIYTFYHIKDSNRNGGKKAISTWGSKRSIPAKGYLNCKDLFKAVSDLEDRSVVLVDEWQFCDECEVSKKELGKLVNLVKEKKISMIISSLDFSFKREAFFNAKLLEDISDVSMVMSARCSCPGCKNPAVFTELVLNGKPASLKDDLVHIGKVDMEFFPKCSKHHKLKEDN